MFCPKVSTILTADPKSMMRCSKRLRSGTDSNNSSLVEELEENTVMQKKVEMLEEENKNLRQENDELKKLRGVMEELQSIVECPVCLVVPRVGGPVSVCSNGHFVCTGCKEQIR